MLRGRACHFRRKADIEPRRVRSDKAPAGRGGRGVLAMRTKATEETKAALQRYGVAKTNLATRWEISPSRASARVLRIWQKLMLWPTTSKLCLPS